MAELVPEILVSPSIEHSDHRINRQLNIAGLELELTLTALARQNERGTSMA